jgi:hypothetical protein
VIASLAAVLLLAAPAATLPPDYPFEKPAPSCPPWLSVWSLGGSLDAGDDWEAILVEIGGGRARLTEMTVRSHVPRIPLVEADWFLSDPLDPEAGSFSVGTRTYSGKPLDDLCQAIMRGGMHAVIARTSAEFNAVEGALVIENLNAGAVMIDRDGRVGALAKPPDPRPPERMPSIPYDEAVKPPPGTIVQPGIDAKQTTETERRDVSVKDPDPERPVDPVRLAEDDVERRALDVARDVLRRQARTVYAPAGGLEEIPASHRILGRLTELDVEGLPKKLPSDFVLASIGAPKNYVTALALDLLADEVATDRLAALRWLGDQPSINAVEDLLAVLRKRPDTAEIQREQALALRALLKAAPDQARMQALRLLTAPRRVARAAMGVFWFTEPSLRRELNTVDFKSSEKVRAMASRIRGHLSVNARDQELKKAAADLK